MSIWVIGIASYNITYVVGPVSGRVSYFAMKWHPFEVLDTTDHEDRAVARVEDGTRAVLLGIPVAHHFALR